MGRGMLCDTKLDEFDRHLPASFSDEIREALCDKLTVADLRKLVADLNVFEKTVEYRLIRWTFEKRTQREQLEFLRARQANLHRDLDYEP